MYTLSISSPLRAGALALAALTAAPAASASTSCPAGAPTSCLATQGTWTQSLQARDFDDDGAIDAYYDTALNLTWLADANYVVTSGVDFDGKMAWADALNWAGSLQLYGGSDWRLPTVTPVDGVAFNYANSFDGSTDIGYALENIGWGTASELGHLYYVTLGNDGLGDGTFQPDSTGPFRNYLDGFYFTNVPYAPSSLLVWGMDMDNGRQSTVFRLGGFAGGGDDGGGVAIGSYVWAVHGGDVIGPPATVVPVGPSWGFLLSAALCGSLLRRRSRCRTAA